MLLVKLALLGRVAALTDGRRGVGALKGGRRGLASSETMSSVPKVVVLDLDATVWTPEVYTLRPPPGASASWTPTLGEHDTVFPGARTVLETLAKAGVRVAIASRSSHPSYSNALVDEVRVADGRSLRDLCGAGGVQIYKGDKQRHLAEIRRAYGCDYGDMAFFDDARDGKWGNCARVAELGVLAVHTPRGLTEERWATACARYASGDRGVVVDAPGGEGGGGGGRTASGASATVPCVSLAMPFAAHLLNGCKTIETRNSRLFAEYEGATLAVRVGKRDWPNEEWKAVHPLAGGELRKGFRRGDVAGTVVIGGTAPLSTYDNVERDACAPEASCGSFGTRLGGARWFQKPVRDAPGKPAVYDVAIPRALLGDAAPAPPALAAGPAAEPSPARANRKARRAGKSRVQSGALADFSAAGKAATPAVEAAPPPPPAGEDEEGEWSEPSGGRRRPKSELEAAAKEALPRAF